MSSIKYVLCNLVKLSVLENFFLSPLKKVVQNGQLFSSAKLYNFHISTNDIYIKIIKKLFLGLIAANEKDRAYPILLV